MQDSSSTELQEAYHPDEIMTLLAMAKTNGPCDFVVMDGMCLNFLRFTDDMRFLIYDNLSGEKVGTNLRLLHDLKVLYQQLVQAAVLSQIINFGVSLPLGLRYPVSGARVRLVV